MLDNKKIKNLHIVLYLSYDCNLRCSYCVLNFEKKVITLQNIKKIIKFIKNNTSKFEKIFLEFIGGEPLIQKDIIKNIFSYNLGKNVFYQITTNGLFINNEVYNDILCKIDIVNLSFNENYFNKEILFKKISKNILNKENVSINFIYDPKKPLEEIKKNFLLVLKNGYKKIYILPIVLVHSYDIDDFKNLLNFINFTQNFKQQVHINYLYYLQEKDSHFEFTVDPQGNILGDNMGSAEYFFGVKKKINTAIGKIGNLSLDEIMYQLKDYSYRNYLENMTIYGNTVQDFENLQYLSKILKKYDRQN